MFFTVFTLYVQLSGGIGGRMGVEDGVSYEEI